MRMLEIDVRTKELNHVSMADKPIGLCLRIGLDPGTAGVARCVSPSRLIRQDRSGIAVQQGCG